jgi:hypothetical protein
VPCVVVLVDDPVAVTVTLVGRDRADDVDVHSMAKGHGATQWLTTIVRFRYAAHTGFAAGVSVINKSKPGHNLDHLRVRTLVLSAVLTDASANN